MIAIEELRVEVPEAEDRRLARDAAPLDALREIVEARDVRVDVELAIVLQRDEQRAARELVASEVAVRELLELPPGLGGMDVGHHGFVKPERTEAIILQTFPARERDKMVVFLTPDHGKRKGWAYGARSMRSRFGAALEPLAKVRIGYIEKESDEIVRIESIDLVRSLFPAQQDLLRSVSATYIAEMIDTFAPANDPAELLYRLLDRTTEALLDGAPAMSVVTYAEIWILRIGGIFPSSRECSECHEPLGRPLRFDPRGFVCANCAARDAFIVPNDVADTLDAIGRLPVAEFAARGTELDTLFELRSLAGTLRRNFLGHELKSFEVLAAVTR